MIDWSALEDLYGDLVVPLLESCDRIMGEAARD